MLMQPQKDLIKSIVLVNRSYSAFLPPHMLTTSFKCRNMQNRHWYFNKIIERSLWRPPALISFFFKSHHSWQIEHIYLCAREKSVSWELQCVCGSVCVFQLPLGLQHVWECYWEIFLILRVSASHLPPQKISDRNWSSAFHWAII